MVPLLFWIPLSSESWHTLSGRLSKRCRSRIFVTQVCEDRDIDAEIDEMFCFYKISHSTCAMTPVRAKLAISVRKLIQCLGCTTYRTPLCAVTPICAILSKAKIR